MIGAVMGVDPGVNGGLAILRNDGPVVYLRAFRPDFTREELGEVLRVASQVLGTYDSRQVFLEKVQYMGKREDNPKGDGGKGAFTFGRVYGGLEQGLIAHGMSVRDVYPLAWQARLECPSGGNKNVTKSRAVELFPKERITHAVADALLIAEYGRRVLWPAAPR